MGRVAFTKPRQLCEQDCLDGFSCGAPLVDSWLAKHAKGAKRAGTAVVYVSFCEDKLAGFYTLSSQSIRRDGIRGWLARNTPEQIPVILLGMLGVDKHYQGSGLGHNLLLDATKRALSISDNLGARALVVDPLDDEARAFYQRRGFRDIPGSERMFARLT